MKFFVNNKKETAESQQWPGYLSSLWSQALKKIWQLNSQNSEPNRIWHFFKLKIIISFSTIRKNDQRKGQRSVFSSKRINIKIIKSHSSDGVCKLNSLVLEERVIRLKKGPVLSGQPGSNIRGISMNWELIPRATALGHSSSFCGFALAGYSTFSPDSALLASRDE